MDFASLAIGALLGAAAGIPAALYVNQRSRRDADRYGQLAAAMVQAHDMRNQLQTIESVVDRGLVSERRQQLLDVAERLRDSAQLLTLTPEAKQLRTTFRTLASLCEELGHGRPDDPRSRALGPLVRQARQEAQALRTRVEQEMKALG